MPISQDVHLGDNVTIYYPELVNLYGCKVGEHTQIGPFVEIQRGAEVGRLCKIASHSFICEGVTIEDEVFVGHGVMFINDRYPRATTNGRFVSEADREMLPVRVKRGASLGTGAVIMGGVTIGKRAIIGAGAVVTEDVPDDAIVVGVPAKVVRYTNK